MKIIGLTGSIGMGKSTASRMFRQSGVPVFDADASVHELIGPAGQALSAIEKAFPGVTGPQGVDRQALGARVFQNDEARQRLESILHPLVAEARVKWIKRQRRYRRPLIVLDIPLLFETGGAQDCDYIVVVSAPYRLQKERVMRRPQMTPEKFAGILKSQTPDQEKRRRADFIILTGRGFYETRRQIKTVIRRLRQTEQWVEMA